MSNFSNNKNNFEESYQQQQQKFHDRRFNNYDINQKKSKPTDYDDEFNKDQNVQKQIYYKSSGLTNFMILDDIKKDVRFPTNKINVEFRNIYLNKIMRSFFASDLEQKSPTMQDFAFNFQNMFYTKLLYSGMFKNVYCGYDLDHFGVLNLRFNTDIQDSYRLRIVRTQKSKNHRFISLGGDAELNGVFGFCEKISYNADVALFFDNQFRHFSKYEISLPFIGDLGALRANISVIKRKVDDSLQFKRRRRKFIFYPNEWQNTCFSYSHNSLTQSLFQPFNSETQRLYFLSMDYGINKLFRNKYARSFFNQINDAAFLNNKLLQKEYQSQHEVKINYQIPEQRFQIKPGTLLKYSYFIHNKLFIGNSLGFKSSFKSKITYFEKKKFLLTSSIETGMLTSFGLEDSLSSRSSLEGGSSSGETANLNSTLEQSLNFPTINYDFNSFQLQNVPGYYQAYKDNKNISFYFAIKNKLYLRKFNFFGFKPFVHANFYYANLPSKPIINCGLGFTRHFNLIDSKIDFLINSPNLLNLKQHDDKEFSKLQIILNP
ncbi:hypothetical protein ABPG72_014999 [Tetrahymena utriculariae]